MEEAFRKAAERARMEETVVKRVVEEAAPNRHTFAALRPKKEWKIAKLRRELCHLLAEEDMAPGTWLKEIKKAKKRIMAFRTGEDTDDYNDSEVNLMVFDPLPTDQAGLRRL